MTTPPIFTGRSCNSRTVGRPRRLAPPKRLGKILWFSVVVFLCLVPHGLAAGSETMESRQRELKDFSEKETALVEDMHRLELELNQAKQRAASLKKEIHQLAEQINANRALSESLEIQIRQNEAVASRRLVALYKLYQLGQLHFMASAESIYDLFNRKTSLEIILQHDEKVLSTLMASKVEQKQIQQRLNDQKRTIDALEADLTRHIQHMATQKQKRALMLNDIQNKKSLTLASIESLKASAGALDDTLSGFKKEIPAVQPYVTASPQRFSDLKGLLIMPVEGKITDLFGPYRHKKFNIVNFRSGININAERGEPIHAVYKGVTLYASWFKGYGNLIIIDHGDHYYTLYAHAEELFKQKGDAVETGEVVGTVGDSGSMAGPSLHFEVRHHGKPINPLPWIKRG